MQYSKVLHDLQNLTNRKITQSELVKVLDISQAAMANRQKRDSRFTTDELSN